MRVIDIQTLLKFLLSLLVSLLPLYNVFSQATDNKKVNKISVKLIKTVNGKTVITDTVIAGDDYAKALSSLKGFNADTAMLKRLNKSMMSIQRVDSLLARPGMKASLDDWHVKIKSDTAMFKKLRGDQVRVLELSRHLDSVSIKQLRKSIRAIKVDSLALTHLKDRQLFVMNGDSARRKLLNKTFIFKNGDTIRYENLAPGKHFKFSTDSLQIFRIEKDGENTKIFRRKAGDGIVIETDTLMITHEGDERAVKRHVYVISKNGEGHAFLRDSLGRSVEGHPIRIMIKTKVSEVPDAEREKLKDAGTKVESKKKEILEIEDVNFYPNPNEGRFRLAFNLEQKGDVSIRVLNSIGREIYSEKVKDFSGKYNKEIDLSGVSKGIYYLQVAQGKRFATRKIVIQ